MNSDGDKDDDDDDDNDYGDSGAMLGAVQMLIRIMVAMMITKVMIMMMTMMVVVVMMMMMMIVVMVKMFNCCDGTTVGDEIDVDVVTVEKTMVKDEISSIGPLGYVQVHVLGIVP